ncbi:MAG: M56 family metallopeptidase [Chloroflexi bacterium]|nr:M56 family metallopeptidase [Chloroflexota bacterium]
MSPNRTFALLVVLSSGLIAVIGWSAHHLLLAGAPALANASAWPSASCLLLPLDGDYLPHLASYLFLLAIGAGTLVGLRALVQQQRQTQALLRACLAARSRRRRALDRLAWRLGLEGRLDLVDLAAPVAFCYGYLRPRILVSTGLLTLLPRPELDALLLHEREHLRQRDPLKVGLGKLLASAAFFVPALGALYRRYLVEKELAADQAAIRAQGGTTPLAAALVRLLDHGAFPNPVWSAGASEAIEARIDALLGDPVRLRLRVGRTPLLGSVAVALLAALPLLASPLLLEAAVSSQNVTAGCHLAT